MKFRIVIDGWAGYEVQVKRWWLPFWVQSNFSNTYITLEQAKEHAKNYRKVVWVGYRENLK